jgi:glycerophosphoryl diester phosphodiesterase
VAERTGRRALLLPVAGLAAGIALSRTRSSRHRPGWPYFAGAPLLMAHRGGAQLAPENTLLAFQRAVDWWRADILELDVQPTRDGEAVVFHDETLQRTTDGHGLVAEHTLEELRRLDAGYHFTPDAGRTFPFRGRGIRIPTLLEVLQALPGVRINIEIKDGRAQERVWESIREAEAMDRVLIAAGRTRDRARLTGYPVPVSAGKEQIRMFVAQLRLGRVIVPPRVDALQLPLTWEGRTVVTPELVEAAHELNIAVHVWTVDEVDEMNRLLDWGVDGIITDRPDRLARVLNERVGRSLPPGPDPASAEPFMEYLLRP